MMQLLEMVLKAIMNAGCGKDVDDDYCHSPCLHIPGFGRDVSMTPSLPVDWLLLFLCEIYCCFAPRLWCVLLLQY